MTWRLSEAASRDVEHIYIEGARQFGIPQADRYHDDLIAVFDLLARYPELARERRDMRRPARVHAHGAHVVIYVVDEEGVLVLRVRHARENWREGNTRRVDS